MKNQLDEEEKALLASIEKGEWEELPDIEQARLDYQKIAKETFNKKRKINLRLTERDAELAQIRALQEGMPYQTLLSSVIHKYLTGQLVDRGRQSDR